MIRTHGLIHIPCKHLQEACRVTTSEFDVTVLFAYLGSQHIVCHSVDCLIASSNNRAADQRTTIISTGLISELVSMLKSTNPAVRNVALTHLPKLAENSWFILYARSSEKLIST
jgi:hypothetical protein